MQNANSVPANLPRDQVFRYVDRRPAADIPDLERKHDSRLDHLQEQINKMSVLLESRLELDRKSDTRHNLGINTGFRKVTSGVPESWTSAGAGVTFSQQAVRPGGNTANYSARIAAGANAGTLTQTMPVFPGQRFSMAGWAKVTTGTGLVSLVSDGASPVTQQIKLSITGGAAGGFIAFPSLMLTAPMMEVPTDATTVTMTLKADANSTIDFCEVQYGHGTQRVPHLWVANEADPLPLGGIVRSTSGVWTPTVTGLVNITSVNAGEGQYMRVGNTVTCSVTLSIDPVASAAVTSVSISLPIASNFGAVSDCQGVGFSPDIAGMGGGIYADAANDYAVLGWVSTDIAQRNWCLTFTYQVI